MSKAAAAAESREQQQNIQKRNNEKQKKMKKFKIIDIVCDWKAEKRILMFLASYSLSGDGLSNVFRQV